MLKRWLQVYRPRNMDVDDPKIVQMWVAHHAQDQNAQFKPVLDRLDRFLSLTAFAVMTPPGIATGLLWPLFLSQIVSSVKGEDWRRI